MHVYSIALMGLLVKLHAREYQCKDIYQTLLPVRGWY